MVSQWELFSIIQQQLYTNKKSSTSSRQTYAPRLWYTNLSRKTPWYLQNANTWCHTVDVSIPSHTEEGGGYLLKLGNYASNGEQALTRFGAIIRVALCACVWDEPRQHSSHNTN